MATYNLYIKDSDGKPIPGAIIYVLTTEAGEVALLNNQPFGFVADANGSYVHSAQPPSYVRVQATGYQSKNVTLTPGDNTITLTIASLPAATIEASRTFWNKYKLFIILFLLIAAVWAVKKYNLLSKLK